MRKSEGLKRNCESLTHTIFIKPMNHLKLLPLMIGSLLISFNGTQYFDKTENTMVGVQIPETKDGLEKKVGESSKGNENQQNKCNNPAFHFFK